MSEPAAPAEYRITRGAAEAVVTELGAGLRAYRVGGIPYTQTYPAQANPPLGCGAVLIPWPNRTAGASWYYDREEQRLAVTEPDRGNAIHGLVRKRPWRLVEHAEAHVVCEIDIPAEHGWPEPLRTTIRYELDADGGLTVTHTVAHLGTRAVPFGVGTHPYPKPGNENLADCTLTLAADTALTLDPDTMIPTGDTEPVSYRETPLRELDLDTPFAGCTPDADGLVHHQVRGPGDGVELWAEPVFGYVQVFTPNDFDGHRAIAIEPMTCPPNALNTGDGLITLMPDQTWTGRWGIRPLH